MKYDVFSTSLYSPLLRFSNSDVRYLVGVRCACDSLGVCMLCAAGSSTVDNIAAAANENQISLQSADETRTHQIKEIESSDSNNKRPLD